MTESVSIPALASHPGAQFSVSITIDRQAKQFAPTTKINASWNNHGADSDDLTGSDYMVPLGNVDGTGPGEIKRLDATLADLIAIALKATDDAMILAQTYEERRPDRLASVMQALNADLTPDQIRAELEFALAHAAQILNEPTP